MFLLGRKLKLTSLALGLLIFALGLTILASNPRQFFDSPVTAAEAHPPLKSLLRHYQAEGFRRFAISENEYRAPVLADGKQDWGTVVFQFSPASNSGSFGVSYVTLTAYVVFDAQVDGYQTRGFDVRQYSTD